MKLIKQIKKCPLFEGFSDAEVNKMFDCLKARIVKYSRGQLVAKDNTEVKEICILLEGNLVEFATRNNGKREVIRSLVDGEYFGLSQAFNPPNILGYFVVAALDSSVLYIAADSVNALCNKVCPHHVKLVGNVLRELSVRIAELENNNGYITIKGMRKKIAKLVYDKYLAQESLSVNLGMNRNEMARYLNVSRPSMSREMMRMRDNDGIFEFRKEIINIKNLEKLKKIAEEAE